MIYNLVVAMEAEERHEFWYLIEDKDLYASRSVAWPYLPSQRYR